MKPMKVFLVFSLTVVLALPFACIASSAKSRYPGSKYSVFVQFVNANTNADLEEPPKINVGFNKHPAYHPFIMDTGSCGIVATPDVFKPGANAINLGPGSTYYDSDSTTAMGTYWTATQQIYDPAGNLLATANVPVLQITQTCVTNPDGSTTCNMNPTKFALMGIGFGREGSSLPLKTPAYNAFLNLTQVKINGKLRGLPKEWVNGYVISSTGANLGLTDVNTANAGFVKLQLWLQYSKSNLSEWMPTTMTVNINGASGYGESIMDTGIKFALLTPPNDANLGTPVLCPGTTEAECVPDGVVFNVYFPNEINPVAFYTFTTGQQDNPMQPDSVSTAVVHPNIFFNTSRKLLAGMNFVYDNKNGYCGYIWNGNTSNWYGYVIPTEE